MFYSSGDAITVLFLLIFYALYIFGYITSIIATTHSVKKRIVSGEDFSSGSIFLWFLGWSSAMSVSLGLATIIYFFVKRTEINDTKQQASAILTSIRYMNMQQWQQQQWQQPYQQQQYGQQPYQQQQYEQQQYEQ